MSSSYLAPFRVRKIYPGQWPLLTAAQSQLRNVESKLSWNVFTDLRPSVELEDTVRQIDAKILADPRRYPRAP